MSGILAPGYLRWDGTKYVTDPTVEIVGPPGPPGAPSGTPAGGDLLGTFPDPIVVGLRGLPISASIPTSGQVLEFNGSSWAPSSISTTLGGDVTGATSSNTVSKIQGVAISGTPAAGYVLEATGSTAASWQAPGSTITLSGDVTGAANANTVDKINGTSVPATPIANQVLVATSGITATWQLISNSEVSPAAAITGDKIVPSFGSQNVSTTGTLSAGATTVTSLQDTGLSTGVVHSNSSGNFTSSLVINADIAAAGTANIAVNKLAAGTAGQILQNNGTPTPTWTTVSGDITISNTGAATVVAIQNNPVRLQSLGGSQDGYILTWHNAGPYWEALPAAAITSVTMGGDVTGNSASSTVIKINGASVPISGSLTTGNVLQVNAVSSLTYGAVNLAGGTNFVTGVLPTGNQAAQTMGGDVTGTTAASTVAKIQGNTVTSGALTKGQFFVASSASNWAATSLSGDLLESATIAGSVEVTGILNNVLPALSDGYLTWTGSVWAFTSGTGGGGSGFTAGGDLTGTSSSQQVVSLSGTTGSVQAQIGSLGAGAGAHFASKGVIQIPNNNNAAELDLIMARNNINTADINIIGYSFGVLSFGNTAEVVAVVGNNVQLNTASGTPFVVTGSAAVMQGLSTFEWSANTTTPTIKQVTPASDVATNTLLIQSQSAFSGATGSNRNAGQLQLLAGVPASGGVSSVFMGDAAGTNGVQIQSAALGVEFVSSTNYQFGSTGMSQTGTGAIGINNASVVPTTAAANGGQIYSTSNFVTILGGSGGGVQLYSGDKTATVVAVSNNVGLGGNASVNVLLGTSAPADGGAGIVGLQVAGTIPTSAGGQNGAGIEFYAHALGGSGNPVSFELNAPTLTFNGLQNGIKIFQTQAAPALSGQALQILGQQGGTGSTTGGSILLAPGIGSGGGPNGSVILESADTTSGRITVADLSNGGVVLQSGGTISDPTFSLVTNANVTIFTSSVDSSTTNYFTNYVAPVVQGSIDVSSVHPQTAQRQLYTAVGQTTVSGQILEANIPISSNTSCIMLITSIFRIVVAGSGTAVNDTFCNYQQACFKVNNSGTVSGVGTSQNSLASSTDASLNTSAITIGLATANTIHVELIPNYSGTAATGDGTLWIEVLFN